MVDVRAFQTDMETLSLRRLTGSLRMLLRKHLQQPCLRYSRNGRLILTTPWLTIRVSVISPVSSPQPAERPNEVGAMADDAAIQLELNLQTVENLEGSKD